MTTQPSSAFPPRHIPPSMSVQGSSHDQSTSSTDKQSSSFAQLQPPLHPLLLSALSSIELCHPTQVQKEFIPLALNGNDILARSRTGSGKTLAYALPILQAILESKAKRRSTSGAPLGPVMAIVLVPTRELSEQVTAAISSVCSGLGNETPIEIANFAGGDSKRHKRDRPTKSNMAYLNNQPDVLVSTPARLLDKLRTVPLDLSALAFLVLDEADLMLSYGHSFDDIKSILSGSGNSNGHSWRFPTFYQSFLMSATMTSEVAELKSLVLRNPEVLYVKESVNELNNLTQFSIKVPNEQDKFLLIYVIFRLKLIKGKALVFVNSTDKSYQLKLFLEKFGIRSGVLNSELPFNSRYHAVQEFNKGVFDYLIATDESEARVTEEDPAQVAEPPIEESTLISTQPTPTVPDSTIAPSKTSSAANPKKRKNRGENWHDSQDKATDYGVSRGVNFVNVACVINFDLPLSTDSYTHRIGRTARAGRTGIALSFVLPDTKPNDRKPDKHPNRAVMETEMWQKIEAQQTERGSVLNEYKFDMAQVEGFRYRMEDGLRSVTKAAVREARIKEIKHEVLNSIKLKSHFDENPNDYLFLKHDKPLHPTRIQAHMKHVPSYLIPKISSLPIRQQTDEGASQGPSSSAAGTNQPLAVGFHKKNNHGSSRGRGGAARGRGGSRGASGRGAGGGRKKNPLKSFSAR